MMADKTTLNGGVYAAEPAAQDVAAEAVARELQETEDLESARALSELKRPRSEEYLPTKEAQEMHDGDYRDNAKEIQNAEVPPNRQGYGIGQQAKKPKQSKEYILRRAAQNGTLKEVIEVCADSSTNLNKTTSEGFTALSFACENGHTLVVEHLLTFPSLDPNISNGLEATPFYLACRNGHSAIVLLLLADPRTDVEKPKNDSSTPLIISCQNGHHIVVQHILANQRADVNKANKDGATPFFIACERGDPLVVEKLLADQRVDVNKPNNDGISPLFRACHKGNLPILQSLLKSARVDVEKPKYDGSTLLHVACERGHLEVVSFLLEDQTIDVNKPNKNGATPFFMACQKEIEQVVLVLLAHERIDINKPDKNGATPLFIACEEGHSSVVSSLLADHKVQVNMPDKNGATPLFIACQKGNRSVMSLLLAVSKVDVNKPDDKNITPLWIASQYGHVEVVRHMLARGKNIDTKTRSEIGNRTAAENARVIASLQMEQRENMEIHRRRETNGLAIAGLIDSYEKDPVSVRSQLRNQLGLEADRQSNGHQLWNAAALGELETVRSLTLDPSVNVNWVDKESERTPFYRACGNGHVEVAQHFFTLPKLDPNLWNVNGITSFAVACQNGQSSVVSLLLAHPEIDVNKAQREGATPFFMACQNGRSLIVPLLLGDTRVDVNQPRNDRCTPLWIASQEGHLSIVQHMLASDKEINTKTRSTDNNATAAEHARELAACAQGNNESGEAYQQRKSNFSTIADLIDSYEKDSVSMRSKLREQLSLEDINAPVPAPSPIPSTGQQETKAEPQRNLELEVQLEDINCETREFVNQLRTSIQEDSLKPMNEHPPSENLNVAGEPTLACSPAIAVADTYFTRRAHSITPLEVAQSHSLATEKGSLKRELEGEQEHPQKSARLSTDEISDAPPVLLYDSSQSVRAAGDNHTAKRRDSTKIQESAPTKPGVLESATRTTNSVPEKETLPTLGYRTPAEAESEEKGIFNAQYNVAVEVINAFIEKSLIRVDPPEKLTLNIIYIMPSFSAIRDQVERRLGAHLQAYAGINGAGGVDFVINAANLVKQGGQELAAVPKRFIENICNPKFCNLIVHDEDHWGISEGSNINLFLNAVVECCKQNISRKLMFFGVSATPFALANLGFTEISWSTLRRQDPTFFATPSYRSIEELQYRNHRELGGRITQNESGAEITVQVTEITKSAAVLQEYKTRPSGSVADDVLKDLEASDNTMAVVRLCSTADAKSLRNHFLEANTGKPKTLLHFYVIGLFEDLPTFQVQLLNQTAGKTLHPRGNLLSLEDLDTIPVLVIVVDKLSIGETIPGTTRHYDIRGKYNDASTRATLVQDIGRCAGHKRLFLPATVYTAFDKPLSSTSPSTKETQPQSTLNFEGRKEDLTLTARGKPAAVHPEREGNSKAFTNLVENAVLLFAEPQIGKTGVILSTITLLLALISGKASDLLLSPTSSNLRRLTQHWSAIATEKPTQFPEMFRGDHFLRYHDAYDRGRKQWGTGEPYADIVKILTRLDNNLEIADCGCGRGGLIPELTKVLVSENEDSHADNRVIVHGFDVDNSINTIKGSSVCNFIPHVGDMAPDGFQTKKLDAVVYCLSLFEEEVSRHVNWAHHHLKDRGSLIITDVHRRFLEDFEAKVNILGFSKGLSTRTRLFTTWSFEKAKKKDHVKMGSY